MARRDVSDRILHGWPATLVLASRVTPLRVLLGADLDLAAHGRAPYAQPAPLSQNLALDRFRNRVRTEANARDRRRRIAELMPAFPPPGLDVSSVLAAVSANPAGSKAVSEQSNPIPAAGRASAAR